MEIVGVFSTGNYAMFTMDEKANGRIPVTEVEEAAVVIWVLILKAQVRPAAQTVVSYAQLLGHSGLSGFPSWRATCTER